MKNLLTLTAILFIHVFTFAQTKKFKIRNTSFIIKSETVSNEWESKDEVRHLLIRKNGSEKLVLTYFAYKDEGGDCNNLFWYKEWLKVKDKKNILYRHYFQKTGLDPITEWEKKTFTINKNDELELTEHLFKKIGSNEWKTQEEWYKQ